ncbi:hypothetical protein HHL24_40240 [Paraburkholderia sp. RP-4-7]|uniref:Uncharacterized protein n=1 Tax=Paraburkholderia polaris TaxID=2728848 RepID=A0A848IYQ1_9BURK|nr:hypothetical protein [Paraburkholderia polaris]NMM04077.1 hypothetical protein [Paraburkholderia polaris]
MSIRESNLRLQIGKWFAPTPALPVRIKRLALGRSGGRRYVAVEVSRYAGGTAIWFFRHREGNWQVFPPDIKRPALQLS